MTLHHVAATPETVRAGMFAAAFPPILTVRSGDTVVLQCLSGAPEAMPPASSGFTVPAELPPIHAANLPKLGPHIVTGPVAVEGAMPGDVLEVRIDAIEFGADWGFCLIAPLVGTLPEDFPEHFFSHIGIDAARRVGTLPWGMELPLSPFFGVLGVAPPARYGTLSSKEPREHGGNLDNKELVAGTTLFLPVWVDGANFSAGDGHGVQGDGEVCVTALETCLTGTFTLTLHKAQGSTPLLRYPRAETPTHFISMGMNEDLDVAMKTAVREMIGFICGRSNLSREQAYQLCSLAADFHVTQTVNGEKGVHGMLAKSLLT